MTKPIQALSFKLHGSKHWKPSKQLSFAARTNAVGLLADELPRAALVLPLAFLKQDERYVPSAILGLAPGENLLLDPDHNWLGRYTPAAFRAYPFVLARPAGDGKEDDDKRVLCVANPNDAIVDADQGGTPIFDANGEASPEIKKLVEFLTQMEASRGKTERSVNALAEAGVIVPWKLQLQRGDKRQVLDGLFHVDEKALNALPDEAYLKLRRDGGIALAHMMLLSEQNLPALVDLARRKQRAVAKAEQSATQH